MMMQADDIISARSLALRRMFQKCKELMKKYRPKPDSQNLLCRTLDQYGGLLSIQEKQSCDAIIFGSLTQLFTGGRIPLDLGLDRLAKTWACSIEQLITNIIPSLKLPYCLNDNVRPGACCSALSRGGHRMNCRQIWYGSRYGPNEIESRQHRQACDPVQGLISNLKEIYDSIPGLELSCYMKAD